MFDQAIRLEAPAIFHNLLETEGDRSTAVSAMKICRQLMEASPMKDFLGKELTPWSEYQ